MAEQSKPLDLLGLAPLFLAILIGCAGETTVVNMFLEKEFVPALAVHLGTSFLLILLAYVTRVRTESGLVVFAAFATVLTGPFGVALSLVANVIYLGYARDAAPPTVWLERFFEFQKDEEVDHLHDRIAFGREDFASSDSVEPFQDVLNGSNLIDKQIVLAKITRHFSANLAPILLQAVNDENAAVRVQAATSLARLERNFMTRRMALEKKLALSGDDKKVWLELAEVYDEYAYAGLADAEECTSVRAKAIDIYEAHQANNPSVQLKLARLYLRDGKAHKTCAVLQETLKTNPFPEAIAWYLEALFRLRRFEDLRLAASTFMSDKVGTTINQFAPEIKGVIAFWTSAGAPVEETPNAV